MKNQFDLVLTNTAKMLVVGVGCFLVMMTFLFSMASNGVKDWIFWAVMLPVLYGLYRLVKEFSGDMVQITIVPDKLLILNKQSGRETAISFANISSYRYQEYNGNPQLRLKLRDGSRQEFQVYRMHSKSIPAFKKMAQAFESATQSQTVAEGATNLLFQQEVGTDASLQITTKNAADAKLPTPALISASLPTIVREKTFFEKPASTVALVAMVVLIIVILAVFATSSKPLNGTLISSLGAALSYIGAWYAARQQNKK